MKTWNRIVITRGLFLLPFLNLCFTPVSFAEEPKIVSCRNVGGMPEWSIKVIPEQGVAAIFNQETLMVALPLEKIVVGKSVNPGESFPEGLLGEISVYIFTGSAGDGTPIQIHWKERSDFSTASVVFNPNSERAQMFTSDTCGT